MEIIWSSRISVLNALGTSWLKTALTHVNENWILADESIFDGLVTRISEIDA